MISRQPIVLTDDEVVDVTKKKTAPAQIRALRFMCIAHKVRPDGSVMVLRSALFDEAPEDTVQESEIRW